MRKHEVLRFLLYVENLDEEKNYERMREFYYIQEKYGIFINSFPFFGTC